MLELLAFAWLYLAGLLVCHRLQDHTIARDEYGIFFWPLLLVWPVSFPIGAVLAKLGR